MLKIKKTLSHKGNKIEYSVTYREQKYIRLKIIDQDIQVSSPLQAQDWEIEQLIYRNISKINKIIEFREKTKKVIIANPGSIKIFDIKNEAYFSDPIKEDFKLAFKTYENDDLTVKHMYKKLSNLYFSEFEKVIHKWLNIMQLELKNLSVKEMKGKWGVCYPEKSKVVLNIKLLHYPKEALEYVTVHELSHLVHKNHSRDFWYHVEKFLPKYKEYSGLLKLSI
ncbi:YgjP-like metallopeptidase domain-containing protein [Spiroplasma culicicola]|uniref:Zinc metalloprotease n=1 Tax=Spiroplasma culicicola AES-1 TaxID=1276246 RepID=W6AFS8_9MOLU|nr:YgjP-like metallopeptidase domain-containing protein [Spiroplasma culicicola]AHI52564.1 zinc metalloprotease [Spiroplasma culicicola AES-1]